MRLRTIHDLDMIDQIQKAIESLPNHPWITTESDLKCALYAALFRRLEKRIANLSSCGWRITTEYVIPTIGSVDFAILKSGNPFLLIELKFVKALNESTMKNVKADYSKRISFVKAEQVRLLQVIISTFNGQYKEYILTDMIDLFKDDYSPSLKHKGVDVKFLRVQESIP